MKLLHGYGRLVLILLAVLVLIVGFAVWFVTATPGASHRGPLPQLDADGPRLADELRKHVAGVASEEHNVAHPEALERSAVYIESALAAMGYSASRQEFQAQGVKVRNLEVTLGSGKQVVVIGAHYDSARGAVGADDNGSGVAALLELARLLNGLRLVPDMEVR